MIGLQNQRVLTIVYDNYTQAVIKRNGSLVEKIDQALKADETGILFIREDHHLQFPKDIQVFYVSPPALDDINRWLRDRSAQASKAG